MDIESSQPQFSRNQHQIYKSLVILLQKQPLNMLKACKLSQKYQNHQDLCTSLLNLCRQSKNMKVKLNIINFLVQIFRVDECNLNNNARFIKQTFSQVYDMRWSMEKQSGHQVKNHLSILNQLIKIIKKLIEKIKSHLPLLNYLRNTVYQCENVKYFINFNNMLFTLKILLLLNSAETFQQTLLEVQIADYYLTRLLQFNSQTIETQQIITIAFLNCALKYQNLGYKLIEFINQSTFYQKLIIMEERIPQERCLEFLKLNLCQNQTQFQLITQIVSSKYADAWPTLKRQLCIFWLINCNKFLQVDETFDLSHYISAFQPQISSEMVSLLNAELNQQKQVVNRRNILQIWSKFLLDPKVQEHVLQHKTLFIGTELIFYRFIREILNEIENTLNQLEMEIVLETFSRYFPHFLQQQQCEGIRKKITNIYVEQYAHFLTPYFLIRSKENYKEYSAQITNLSIFNPETLQNLLLYVETGKETLLDLLGRLRHEVSVIILKYISQQGQWEYNQLFAVNQIVQYLFENNIQIHMDKFQYQFYKKVSENVEKYMKFIRSSNHQNRYERFLNSYILDLLENQLLNQTGLKKLPISFTIIIYIVERYEDFYNTSEQKGSNVQALINSLYALANRSLFVNIPDAYYLLILAISHLKQFTNTTFYEIEAVVLQNLIKFMRHYENHDSYLFFGFASLLVVLYGLPNQENKVFANYNWCEQVIVGPLLIQNIGKLLSFKIEAIINRKPQQLEEKIANRADLITRKIIIYNILRRIHILILKSGMQNNNEALYLENLVQKLIDAEIQIQKPTYKIEIETKIEIEEQTVKNIKRTKYLYDEEQLLDKSSKRQISNVKICQKRTNSLQKLFDKIQTYDEFKYFRTILSLLRGSIFQNSNLKDSLIGYAKLQRVGGKVRTILHVKK